MPLSAPQHTKARQMPISFFQRQTPVHGTTISLRLSEPKWPAGSCLLATRQPPDAESCIPPMQKTQCGSGTRFGLTARMSAAAVFEHTNSWICSAVTDKITALHSQRTRHSETCCGWTTRTSATATRRQASSERAPAPTSPPAPGRPASRSV